MQRAWEELWPREPLLETTFAASPLMRYRSSKAFAWLCVLMFAVLLGNCSKPKAVPTAPVPNSLSTTSTHVAPTVAPVVDSWTVQAPEPEFFVRPAPLKQRALPNGTVVGSLVKGVSVKVYVRQGSWGRVSPDGQPERWVSMAHLCSDRYCVGSRTSASTQNSAQLGQSTVRTPSVSRLTSTYSGGCPCSSSNSCIGRRGGRYCITSGGNKRYR